MNEITKKELVSFPSPFIRAIQNDKYTKGHSKFSVTQLISPPYRTFLKLTNEEIRSPYGSFMALLGTAVHNILEENVDLSAGEMAEVRMFKDFNVVGTQLTISGQIDFYEPFTVYDYKITGGVQDEMKPEHYRQVQMNAYLATQNGIKVYNVAVVYVQRDWSYMQSTLNPAYPKTPFKVFVHPYNEMEAIEDFQISIGDHLAASLGNPRPCTDSEMWAKPDTFALMKPGAKRASKVCASYAEAEDLKSSGQFIQTRKGERTFCSMFCGLGHVCPIYQKHLASLKNETMP